MAGKIRNKKEHSTPQLASPPTPLQGERGVICYTTTKLINKKCNAIARHITPLSPWRGAGGEAFFPWRGVGGEAFYFFLSAFFPSFSLTLQLLSGLFAAVYADKCVLDN